MDKAISINPPAKPRSVSENVKYLIISCFSFLLILNAFLMNTPKEIIEGIRLIILSPSILLTDYIAVGNMGAAFFNSGLLMLLAILLAYFNKSHMNGTLIAAVFTVAGFAFFGKNIFNVVSIILGVYIYSLTQKEKFGKYIIVGFFGTSLSPVVSQLSFGFEEVSLLSIVIGNLAGIIAGILLPPLAGHFVKFHQGFSLYNIGFTCGIIGTFFMSIIRALGEDHELISLVSNDNNLTLSILFTILFISMILIGCYYNGRSFKNYFHLFRHSGRLIADFVIMDGFGVTMINMGVLGLTMLAYVLILKGDLNGPTIGGILTVVGFGAFGKHPKNVIPIIGGVFLASLFWVYDVNSTSVVIAALFSTTLAPIAGKFGAIIGIIAGFLHLTLVMNIGDLHGGMNLYNNGFSGGIVAATLVPIIEAFRKDED